MSESFDLHIKKIDSFTLFQVSVSVYIFLFYLKGVISGQQVICTTTDGRLLGIGGNWKDVWSAEAGNRRNIHMNSEWLLLWGKGGAEQPQPWSPLARDYERANLHLYFLASRGPELLAHKKTDAEPILIVISKISSRTLISIEQKVNQRGNVSVEVVTLELISNVLKRVMVTLVPLQTQVSCCALSDDEERVALGCIDGSIAVLTRNRGSTRIVKAGFIPKFVVWHRDGAIFAIANEKGQIQYFDCALNIVQSQLVNEDGIVNGILDLSNYMKTQLIIDCIFWGFNDLLLVLEQGTLIVIANSEFSLSFTALIQRYISDGKLDKAISLLLSWDFNQQSYCALQKICTCLMKLPLTEENSKFLQDALGSFHSPAIPINSQIRHKFGLKVQYLTRRFFHQLVRASMFETAFLLAVDLGHHDLFMDLHYIAIKIGETEMAAAARAQASALLSRCSSEASDCSRSSCSQCTESETSSSSTSEELPDDNYLTTNFNNATPKTYQLPKPKLQLAPPLPFVPIENHPARTFSIPNLNTSRPLTNRFTTTTTPYNDDLFMFSAHSASNSNINTIKYTPIRNIQPPPLPTTSVLTTTSTNKKPQAKVKFSDTVTAFIVPEVKRPVRPTPPAHITDPQKELADSLPLCSPNEDYLKDFAPVRRNEQADNGQQQPQAKIKVVHFGVV